MKLFKVILGAAVCLGTVNCKIQFSGEGEIIVQPCETILYSSDSSNVDSQERLCGYDLSKAPTSFAYFHGGWYGPTPNYRLSLSLARTGDKVLGHVDSPKCKIEGAVDINEFIILDQLSTDVATKIQDADIIDAGDESLSIADTSGVAKLFLRTSDSGYKKPVVRDAGDAEAIRKQVNKIADALLARCASSSDSITSIVLTERVNPDSAVADKDSILPHSRLDLTVQDIRINLNGVNDGRINGYRIVTKPKERCTTKIDAPIRQINDLPQWKSAASLLRFEHSAVVCAMALGLESEEDYRVYFPTNPKRLTATYQSGEKDFGLFGCLYSDRVLYAEKLEALVNNALKVSGKTTCEIIK